MDCLRRHERTAPHRPGQQEAITFDLNQRVPPLVDFDPLPARSLSCHLPHSPPLSLARFEPVYLCGSSSGCVARSPVGAEVGSTPPHQPVHLAGTTQMTQWHWGTCSLAATDKSVNQQTNNKNKGNGTVKARQGNRSQVGPNKSTPTQSIASHAYKSMPPDKLDGVLVGSLVGSSPGTSGGTRVDTI